MMRSDCSARLPTIALAVLALLSGCSRQAPVESVQERGTLRVVTLNSPTSFYYGADGLEGFEYQLASAFAHELGVTLVMYPVADVSAMQKELGAGRADIAAAQLTADGSWSAVGDAAQPYEYVPQLVVYRRGETRPRGTLQLESAKLAVRAGSPQEGMLKRLKHTTAPTLAWTATAPRTADPLEDLESGQADYALVDAREFSFARHLFPDIDVGFALPVDRPAQWVVRHGQSDLLRRANSFFKALTKSGKFAQIAAESSGDTRPFQYEESREFQENIAARLPRFQSWFEEASIETGIDWRLLAAIGYQESKWSASAESADGALGVMMLTSSTALAMGVKDRADARQSIGGGGRYFAEVRDKVPARIPEPDRTWLALAAYNVGFGHLEDARILAQSRGDNPDSWVDVSKCLPLLGEERWYSRAKRGYARGWEPVQFVQRVQSILTLLEWRPDESVATAQVLTAPAAKVPD